MKKTIVVSAVSLRSLRKGGTLTILRNCLEYLSTLAQTGECRIVALVHKKELAFYPGIEYIEMPDIIKSWSRRLRCVRCVAACCNIWRKRDNFGMYGFTIGWLSDLCMG